MGEGEIYQQNEMLPEEKKAYTGEAIENFFSEELFSEGLVETLSERLVKISSLQKSRPRRLLC